MSFFKRLFSYLRFWRRKEADPRVALRQSLDRQNQLLQQVRSGVTAVVTSRMRLEAQTRDLQQRIDKAEAEARAALVAGDEAEARRKLERQQGWKNELVTIESQLGGVRSEEERLDSTARQLQARISAFSAQIESLDAGHSAAQAELAMQSAQAGLTGEFTGVEASLQQAADQTLEVKARAAALEELSGTGSGGVTDPELRAQLEGAPRASLDDELARLKADVERDRPGEATGHA